MSKAYSDAEIDAGLAKLKGWARDGDELVKEFRFDNYPRGLGFCLGDRGDCRGFESSPGYGRSAGGG